MKKTIQTIRSKIFDKLETLAFILVIFTGMLGVILAMPFLIVYHQTMKLFDKKRK